MFAIVDRTSLTPPTASTTLSAAVPTGGGTTINVVLSPNPAAPLNYSSGPLADGSNWNLTVGPGTTLLIDLGTNQEAVVVTNVAGTQLTVSPGLANAHPAGTPVFLAGNPGPQPKFDPRKNRAVVPYFSIID